MSSSEGGGGYAAVGAGTADAAEALVLDLCRRGASVGNLADLSEPAVAGLLGLAVRLAAARIEAGSPPALDADHAPSATEVALVVSLLLRTVGIDVFELGMWQLRGGRPVR